MSNYTITTNFGAKDSLPSGNAGKVIKGSEFTTEFTNIQTAIATKADTAGDTFTGAVTFDAAVTLNSTATLTGDLTVDTDTLFVDVSADKVGIGTSSPSALLHLSSATPSILMQDSDGTGRASVNCDNGSLNFKFNSNNAVSTSILTFSDYNSERMRIDANGNVGIGTTSPAKKLHVLGGDVRIESTFPRLYLTDTNNNSDYSIINNNGQFGIYDDTNATYRMVINNTTGKVGIGTDSPSSQLHVSSTDSVSITQTHTDGNTVSFKQSGTGGDVEWRNGNGEALILTGSQTRMTVDSSGNVGIGTISPSTALDVAGTVTADGLTVSSASPSPEITLHDTDATYGFVLSQFNSGDGVLKTNNTERVRITNAGNVGIGTDSPDDVGSSKTLHINDDTHGGAIRLSEGGTNNAFVSYDHPTGMRIQSIDTITLKTNNADRVHIKSDGNVGIGTTSPTQKLDVTSAGTTRIQVKNTNLTSSGLYIAEDNSGAQINELGAYPIRFNTSGSERMRITSSGKLLIGKTDESVINTVGIEAHPAGLLVATRDNNIPLIANRKTSDGNVAQFRKDNTAVGAIGCFASDITIGKAGSGLRFEDGTSTIRPHNISTNTANDNAITLGNSDSRFKDLYLSGGVYLGGTGSANKLDDYEEGTWTMSVRDSESTPNISSSTNSNCRYIKVGNKVTIEGHLVDINKGSLANSALQITGLPFTIKNIGSNRPHGPCQVNHFSGAQVERGLYIQGQANSTYALIKSNVTDTGASSVSASALNAGNTSDIFFSLTYIAE